MPRLRRKLWLQHGLVNALPITFWENKIIQIETDHKPLAPLLSTTHLDDLPPRILRFRLRLMRFDYTISHVPGKLLCAPQECSN